MVDTGVPLSEALDVIAVQSQDREVGSIVAELSEEVKSGTAFSDALVKSPERSTAYSSR